MPILLDVYNFNNANFYSLHISYRNDVVRLSYFGELQDLAHLGHKYAVQPECNDETYPLAEIITEY